MLQEQRRPLEVFCVAAPEDTSFLVQWEECLLPLQEKGYLTAWSEQHLADEAPHQEETLEHLLRAELILLLVSPHFFMNTECLELMEEALHRYTSEEARVILLLLQSVDDQEAPLMSLLCLPSNGLPVAQWDDTDAAFRDCLQEIFPLVEQSLSASLPALQQEEEQSSHLPTSTRPGKVFAWSWRRVLFSLPFALLIGITCGLGAMLIYGIFIWLSAGPLIGLFYMLFIGLPTALPLGLLIGILSTLLSSVIYGFSPEKSAEDDTSQTIRANEESVV